MTNSHPPERGDFAAMLAAYDATDSLRLHPGDAVSGRVFHISKDHVFVELSRTQEGVLPREDVTDRDGQLTVAVGDAVQAFVTSLEDGIQLGRRLGRDGGGDTAWLEQAQRHRLPVDGTVTGVNKGGLEVTVGGVRGFCPMGQVDLHFVDEPAGLIGQTFPFLVQEIKDRGRTVVLSRRALLVAERAAVTEKLKSSLAVGQRLTGKVTRVANFGAFVDLGGIDGLIPIGELSHSRVAQVTDVVQVGEVVDVEIRSLEDDPKKPGSLRISLSRKATVDSPWVAHQEALQPGASLTGKVVKLEAFGAFVELFAGVQGLVHISEMANKRIRHPGDVVKVGQEVQVRLLSVDEGQKRLSLSLREGSSEDAENSTPAERDAMPPAAPTKGFGTLGDKLRQRLPNKK